MAKSTNPRNPTKETHRTRRYSSPQKDQKQQPHQQNQSWAVMKSILTCKHLDAANKPKEKPSSSMEENSGKKSKKMRCSGSLCNNTKVMQRPDPPSPEIHQRKSRATSSISNTSAISTSSSSLESSNRSIKTLVSSEISTSSSSSSNKSGVLVKSYSSSNASSSAVKGMPFRRLSGCYECRMVVDPVLAFTRDPSLRTTICTCPHCGEVFMKPENLELHQAVRHAGN